MLQTFSGFPVFTISIITTDREVFFFFVGPFSVFDGRVVDDSLSTCPKNGNSDG